MVSKCEHKYQSTMTGEPTEQLAQLREEIAELRREMAEVREVQPSARIDQFRRTCAGTIIEGELIRAKEALEARAGDCPKREKCIPLLSKSYGVLLESLRTGHLSSGEVTEIRRGFEDVQKLCTDEQCGGCLIEANRLFAAQVKLLRSAGVYTGGEMNERVQELEEEGVAAWIGEPLANVIRIRILKSLAEEPRSFADLSKLTGLRGGNLLFHLEKLQASTTISQKGERKEYTITSRGTLLLEAVAGLMDKMG